ncbi:hypothetical protein B0H10DRAFT_1972122 [Mycena sp. CBHHK59/15]|nr:hypothetical protein B0H10DRAFT_1972122 [Mycena sp. CBHHK59/15]
MRHFQILLLQQWKKISAGGMPSLDELLDPPEEREIGQALYKQSPKEADIIAQVHHQEAVARGDIMEVDDDSSNDEEPEDPEMSTQQIGVLAATTYRVPKFHQLTCRQAVNVFLVCWRVLRSCAAIGGHFDALSTRWGRVWRAAVVVKEKE